jgi:hypothetical protein
MQSGRDFANGNITVMASESAICSVAGKVNVTGTPKNGTVMVQDSHGKQIAGAFATGAFTATTASDIAVGSAYTIFYAVDKTSVPILTLDSKSFPKSYYVELHTIAYDIDKNVVTADVYWQFNKALPNGSLSAQYEAGKGNGDDIEFTAQLLAGNSAYGNYVVIPRA